MSHAEKFQACRFSTLKEKEHNSPFFNCGLSIVTSFQRVRYGKTGKSNFTIEKPDKHCLGRVIEVTSTVVNQIDNMYLDIKWWKWHFKSAIFFFQIHNPSLIMRKLSNFNRRTFRNIPDHYSFKLSRSSKLRKVWETVNSHEQLKNIGQLSVMRSPGTEKKTLGKNSGSLGILWALFSDSISVLVH